MRGPQKLGSEETRWTGKKTLEDRVSKILEKRRVDWRRIKEMWEKEEEVKKRVVNKTKISDFSAYKAGLGKRNSLVSLFHRWVIMGGIIIKRVKHFL